MYARVISASLAAESSRPNNIPGVINYAPTTHGEGGMICQSEGGIDALSCPTSQDAYRHLNLLVALLQGKGPGTALEHRARWLPT